MNFKGIFIILSLLLTFNNSSFAVGDDPIQVIRNFYQASEEGDIETITSLITGRFYQRRHVLIEKNLEYSKYLKDQNRGGSILIISSDVNDQKGQASVKLKRILPSGSEIYKTMILRKQADDTWRISDELFPE